MSSNNSDLIDAKNPADIALFGTKGVVMVAKRFVYLIHQPGGFRHKLTSRTALYFRHRNLLVSF